MGICPRGTYGSAAPTSSVPRPLAGSLLVAAHHLWQSGNRGRGEEMGLRGSTCVALGTGRGGIAPRGGSSTTCWSWTVASDIDSAATAGLGRLARWYASEGSAASGAAAVEHPPAACPRAASSASFPWRVPAGTPSSWLTGAGAARLRVAFDAIIPVHTAYLVEPSVVEHGPGRAQHRAMFVPILSPGDDLGRS